MDKMDLLPGQQWQKEIPRALRASDFILIFFSRTSVAKRGYVQREFKLALDTLQEIPEDVIHTIPIRLDECDIPTEFGFLQWCNFFEAEGFEKIVQAIQVGLSQRQHKTEHARQPTPASTPPLRGEATDEAVPPAGGHAATRGEASPDVAQRTIGRIHAGLVAVLLLMILVNMIGNRRPDIVLLVIPSLIIGASFYGARLTRPDDLILFVVYIASAMLAGIIVAVKPMEYYSLWFDHNWKLIHRVHLMLISITAIAGIIRYLTTSRKRH